MKVHSRRLMPFPRPEENVCPQSLCRKNGQEHVLYIKNSARCGEGEVFKQSISRPIHQHLCVEE